MALKNFKAFHLICWLNIPKLSFKIIGTEPKYFTKPKTNCLLFPGT